MPWNFHEGSRTIKGGVLGEKRELVPMGSWCCLVLFSHNETLFGEPSILISEARMSLISTSSWNRHGLGRITSPEMKVVLVPSNEPLEYCRIWFAEQWKYDLSWRKELSKGPFLWQHQNSELSDSIGACVGGCVLYALPMEYCHVKAWWELENRSQMEHVSFQGTTGAQNLVSAAHARETLVKCYLEA